MSYLKLQTFSKSLLQDKRGANAVEYALIMALVAVSGTAVARDVTDFGLENFKVTRPGVVVTDVEQRKAEIAAMGESQARHLCQISISEEKARPAPLRDLVSKTGYGGNDKRVAPFDWAVMVLAADAFGTNNLTSAARLVRLLKNWASARAMTRRREDGNGSNTSVNYGLKRTLNAVLPAWSLFRDNPAIVPADRKLIDGWLDRLVKSIDEPTGGRARDRQWFNCKANRESSNCNNHRYLRDVANMQWGILTNDHARFRKGVERYFIALLQMRENGSLPLETRRGARALWYQRHAIQSLVTMAEMGALQGYDLYGTKIAGKSIHLAIKFLLDGVDDPSIVLAYAEKNASPGPSRNWREQDLRFLGKRGRWHYMAWIEPYIRRFPEHENTQRLLTTHALILDHRPLIARISGGNTSCFYAKP